MLHMVVNTAHINVMSLAANLASSDGMFYHFKQCNAFLVFGEMNLVIVVWVAIKADRALINALDLPALLRVDPGIGLGLVSTTHTADNATTQTNTQAFQGDTL